ncbi:MAG TPA: hypothetical protein PLQ54_07855 [Armatimonadota bacterium]|nr:hypothetical protein [Armatimonadota bacterium]
MSNPITVDLFVEDAGHENLLRPLVIRVARRQRREVRVRVRSGRGGHGKALQEFVAFQKILERGVGDPQPDLIVVAIDANCLAFTEARKSVLRATLPKFQSICVPACPDPHVERWYLADAQAFGAVVGGTPTVPRRKCERDVYKRALAQAVVDAGHPPELGGIEFGPELAEAIDLHRAGRSDSSLKHFIDDLAGRLKRL